MDAEHSIYVYFYKPEKIVTYSLHYHTTHTVDPVYILHMATNNIANR